MISVGKLKNVSSDFNTGTLDITFQVKDMSLLNEITSLKDYELDIKAVRHREKRSLDANAYLWVLCTKMAEALNSSKEEIYEELLQKYGYLYENASGVITVTVKANVEMGAISGHWKLYKESQDGKWKSYMMIKGTSEYNTKEMSYFIDRTVEEAKELEIETLPPAELERMKNEWTR